MPRIVFLPGQESCDVDANTKLLIAGRKAGATVRYGCASCRCGTCGVKLVEGAEQLTPMRADEEKLLRRLKLSTDGSVRLACQARVQGNCTVDLTFQDSYDPDIGFDDDDIVR